MRELICGAISQRRLIRFCYEGGERCAAPYILGVLNTGAEALSAYQTGGYSASGCLVGWKYFHLSKMSDVAATNVNVIVRADYNRDDNRFCEPYCRI